MTVKRKKKGGFSGGRTLTVAFSLCLLAIVAMIGMYTVGKSDQQQKELEQKVAEAEEEARAREQAQAQADAKREQEAEEQREQEETQAASGNAARDKEGEALADAGEGQGEKGAADGTAASDGAAAADGSIDGAELESEFADADPDPAGTGETVILDEAQDVLAVPSGALMRGNQVYVKDDSVTERQGPVPAGFRAVEVETGVISDSYVEIKNSMLVQYH